MDLKYGGIRRAIKWTICIKLSLLSLIGSYFLGKYHPWDVTVNGSIHYYILDRGAVMKIKPGELEQSIVDYLNDAGLTEFVIEPQDIIEELYKDGYGGLLKDMEFIKQIGEDGYSKFLHLINPYLQLQTHSENLPESSK